MDREQRKRAFAERRESRKTASAERRESLRRRRNSPDVTTVLGPKQEPKSTTPLESNDITDTEDVRKTEETINREIKSYRDVKAKANERIQKENIDNSNTTTPTPTSTTTPTPTSTTSTPKSGSEVDEEENEEIRIGTSFQERKVEELSDRYEKLSNSTLGQLDTTGSIIKLQRELLAKSKAQRRKNEENLAGTNSALYKKGGFRYQVASAKDVVDKVVSSGLDKLEALDDEYELLIDLAEQKIKSEQYEDLETISDDIFKAQESFQELTFKLKEDMRKDRKDATEIQDAIDKSRIEQTNNAAGNFLLSRLDSGGSAEKVYNDMLTFISETGGDTFDLDVGKMRLLIKDYREAQDNGEEVRSFNGGLAAVYTDTNGKLQARVILQGPDSRRGSAIKSLTNKDGDLDTDKIELLSETIGRYIKSDNEKLGDVIKGESTISEEELYDYILLNPESSRDEIIAFYRRDRAGVEFSAGIDTLLKSNPDNIEDNTGSEISNFTRPFLQDNIIRGQAEVEFKAKDKELLDSGASDEQRERYFEVVQEQINENKEEGNSIPIEFITPQNLQYYKGVTDEKVSTSKKVKNAAINTALRTGFGSIGSIVGNARTFSPKKLFSKYNIEDVNKSLVNEEAAFKAKKDSPEFGNSIYRKELDEELVRLITASPELSDKELRDEAAKNVDEPYQEK